jgi:hypothetical protein
MRHGICADASDLFELLGPLLIFGIYIIASIVKAVAQKGKSDASGEENESDLKKAVRRRYQEISQRQTGKPPQNPPHQRTQPQSVPSKSFQKAEPAVPQQSSQWEFRQEAIRQRDAHILQRQQVGPKASKPVTAAGSPSGMPTERPMPMKTPKKGMPPTVKKPDNTLSAVIGDPKKLRTAFVLKEILDKPIALRESF